MICGAGDLSRRDVGTIRLEQSVTHVEIAADRADAFVAALGPGRSLENGITVARSDGPPAAGTIPRRAAANSPQGPERRKSSKPHRRGEPPGAGGPKRRSKDHSR